MLSGRFKHLKILPLADKERRRLKESAHSETKLYTIPFSLSAQPPPGWPEIFNLEWYQLSGQVPVRLQRDVLQLTCTLDALPSVFNNLKTAVAQANEKYETKLRRDADEQAAMRLREQQTKRSAEHAVDAALDKLDYS
ncbi:MAG TPA: hypothetical protein VF634_07915 [Pyrinomonadaceae bacterium]|jgi:hypothetical protein